MIIHERNKTAAISASLKGHALPLLLLLGLAVVAFSGVPSHHFLVNWDDQVYVTGNPAIRGFSWAHLKLAFTHYYVGNYAPVQIVSYMLDYALWGLRPAGFLLANISYHFLCALLLYLLLVRQGIWRWGAALGAALFLVHPVQMESVAWVSQRKNLLAMVFFLVSFHAWLSYRDRTGATAWRWYALSIAAFILALLSKSVVVIFPPMLLMHDLLVPPARRRLRDHADKIPFLVVALAVGVLAIVTQVPQYGGGRVHYPDNLLAIPLTMLPVLVRYVRIVLWPDPAGLSIMYFPPHRGSVDPAVLGALGVAAVLLLLGLFLYRRSRPALFWYALFFLGLAPVSQIVPLVTLMNDRYLYFPMLGVAGLVAMGADAVRMRLRSSPAKGGAAATAAAVVVLLAVLCQTRGRVWQNTITLFGDAAAKAPTESAPWSRLAEGYVAAGDLRSARMYYERSASFGRLDDDARYDLARIYLETGKYPEAYRLIWSLIAGSGKPLDGQLLLGEYEFRTGAFRDAEQQLLAYLDAVPNSAHGWYMIGQTYLYTAKYDQAEDAFTRSVDAGGGSPGIYLSMACAESMRGEVERSLDNLEIALRHGVTEKDLGEAERWLANVRRDPRFLRIVRQYGGS